MPEILKGILGPRCDENRDASHQLELKIQALHAGDSAKPNMKVEMWTFHGDGTTWLNATSIFKYIYTGTRDHFARTQKMHFENTHIPHKLLCVPSGVSTIFLFRPINQIGTNLVLGLFSTTPVENKLGTNFSTRLQIFRPEGLEIY